METETPTTVSSNQQHNLLKTPASVLGTARIDGKSIQRSRSTRRIIASALRQRRHQQEHDYTGLLRKTWRTYSLSPLFNFKHSAALFRLYSRSLDAALTQGLSVGFQTNEGGSERSSFETYHGLSSKEDDPEAVRIQVTAKKEQGNGETVVLTAVLLCVDIDTSSIITSHQDHFTYYPVILVSGNKSRTTVLLEWIERHFDCRSAQMEFTDLDLRWMFTLGSTQVKYESDIDLDDSFDEDSDVWVPETDESSKDEENVTQTMANTGQNNRNPQPSHTDKSYLDHDDGPQEPLPEFRPERVPGLHLPACITRQDIRRFITPAPKNTPVFLQYSMADISPDLSTINCKFDSHLCRQLWKRICGDGAEAEEVNLSDMNKFINAIEEHLEYTMSIVFKRLTLSEVATPMAYVAKDGKLKILSSSGVYIILHLISSISSERFSLPFSV